YLPKTCDVHYSLEFKRKIKTCAAGVFAPCAYVGHVSHVVNRAMVPMDCVSQSRVRRELKCCFTVPFLAQDSHNTAAHRNRTRKAGTGFRHAAQKAAINHQICCWEAPAVFETRPAC